MKTINQIVFSNLESEKQKEISHKIEDFQLGNYFFLLVKSLVNVGRVHRFTVS